MLSTAESYFLCKNLKCEGYLLKGHIIYEVLKYPKNAT